MEIAVIDKSVMLKRLRSIEELNKESDPVIIPQTEIDKIKDTVVQSICQTIENLSEKYDTVVIPQTVVNEIRDTATKSIRLMLLDKALARHNVITSDKPCDDIFAFAQNVSQDFDSPVDIITGDIDSKPRVKYTVTIF